MNILVGWSGELSSGVWRKFDISFDETDLYRILSDWELDIEPKAMKQALIFQILNNEAETFLTAKLSTYGVEGAQEKLEELARTRNRLKEKVLDG